MNTAAVKITNCKTSVIITAHSPPTTVYNNINNPNIITQVVIGNPVETFTILATGYKNAPVYAKDKIRIK